MGDSSILERLSSGTFDVAVVGMGYVGLPLAVEFAEAGVRVVGIDIDQSKVDRLNARESYIPDIPTERMAPLVASGHLTATTDFAVVGAQDVVCVCVPTPLNKTKDPDVSMIMDVAACVAPVLSAGTLVVLESTTYPGFTREVFAPKLEEQTGLVVGKDLFIAFSPERVDPGNAIYQTRNTPKIVGGMTPVCTELAQAAYEKIIDTLVPVSSTDCAEMVKLLENTFRAVNIGLVNEVAIMCRKLGLNTWEVIGAAATKPFGFMPFYPGPGLGGHCIPIDPHYLSWKLRTLSYNARFIELAGEVNSGMPEYVLTLVADSLNEQRKCINGSRVLVVGVAYKRDIDDCRESPSLDIMELLMAKGAEVDYHDSNVPTLRLGSGTCSTVAADPSSLGTYDAVIISTDHSDIDYAGLVANSSLVIDCRNATGRAGIDAPHIVRL
jgi:UDP-N-acetyl-D-glucosamine dehydrogenase